MFRLKSYSVMSSTVWEVTQKKLLLPLTPPNVVSPIRHAPSRIALFAITCGSFNKTKQNQLFLWPTSDQLK